MNFENVKESLKKESENNPVSKDIFCLLGMRQRNRSEIKVLNLYNNMRKAGLYHSTDSCRKTLQFLSEVGIGKLKTNKKGKIVSLVEIPISIKMLGQAVYNSHGLKTKEILTTPKSQNIHFNLQFRGKKIEILIEKDFNKDDIIDLIGKLSN